MFELYTTSRSKYFLLTRRNTNIQESLCVLYSSYTSHLEGCFDKLLIQIACELLYGGDCPFKLVSAFHFKMEAVEVF